MKTLKIISLLVILFFTSQLTYAQIEEKQNLVIIETIDGNEFVGSILSEDTEKIVLKTEKFGDLSIFKSDIKSQKLVEKEQMIKGELWFDNPQATRYFWAPNAYGLKKGEGYYQNIYVFWNQASYGITDNISIGGGLFPTFLFGAPTPVFLTPKFSIPVVEDKFNIGGGALLGTVIGQDVDNIGFGIAYGLTTFGSRDSNVSISLGYGYADGHWADSPLVNISGLHRVSKRIYILTENYYIKIEDKSVGLISVGGRWIIKKAALDFLLIRPVAKDLDMGGFIAAPIIGFTIPFGNK